jgi:putative transposase
MESRIHEIALKDQKQFTRFDASKNLSVQLALLDVMEATKEGLMALAVQTGLRVIQAMMQEEVDALVGPKGKHNSERKTVRMEKRKVSSSLAAVRWLWRRCGYAVWTAGRFRSRRIRPCRIRSC